MLYLHLYNFIISFSRIYFKLFFYYYFDSEEIDIYFSMKFFLPTREARERSFASLLPFSSLFNFFKYLKNSSHSDQHFPPFLFSTISNREFFTWWYRSFVIEFEEDSTELEDSITLLLFRNSIYKRNWRIRSKPSP